MQIPADYGSETVVNGCHGYYNVFSNINFSRT